MLLPIVVSPCHDGIIKHNVWEWQIWRSIVNCWEEEESFIKCRGWQLV